MKFSDKSTSNSEIESKNESTGDVFKGRTWDEIEGKELEMINGMDAFIGNCSQHLNEKSKKIMKEWRNVQ